MLTLYTYVSVQRLHKYTYISLLCPYSIIRRYVILQMTINMVVFCNCISWYSDDMYYMVSYRRHFRLSPSTFFSLSDGLRHTVHRAKPNRAEPSRTKKHSSERMSTHVASRADRKTRKQRGCRIWFVIGHYIKFRCFINGKYLMKYFSDSWEISSVLGAKV
jgi:hypothetical protein